MTKRPPTTETRIDLRTILSAGVLAVLLVLACAGTAAGATWVVDDDGGAGVDYTSIQAAVNAAAAGDTIEVRGGTYYENVDANKTLTLIGEGADVVTVRAASAHNYVFKVTADWVNISGFTVTGGTHRLGIYLYHADHCSISDNIASGNHHGIHLRSSSNNTLQSNIAPNNRYGISLGVSNNNTLQSNIMSGNTYNFDIYGYTISEHIQNIDTSNTVDGKPIYYWVDQHDKQIPCDAGFVGVVNSTNITVKDLTLTNNGQGVLFAYTENSRIENVTTSDNFFGICVRYSNNNILQSNTASDNSFGIDLGYYSNNNTLQSNTASSNSNGIRLDHTSINNTLTNNMMSGNRRNFGVASFSFTLSSYAQNIDTSNTVEGKPIYYWVDQHDKQIPCDAGFVGVVDSTNITVKDLTLTNNEQGVLFAYTENSRIENVTTLDNSHGIILSMSSGNMLQSNNVSDNHYGIELWYTRDNILQSNDVSSNSFGIRLNNYLYGTDNNTIYHNNIIDNNQNAYDDDNGPNQWDSGSEGNYWGDDYTGTDSDGDGIGDDPHPIPGGSSVDRYPLMEPWSEPTPTGSVHNINKGTDYTTIQAAIDDADIGDEIHVDSGTYYENVVVNKQLTLRGIDTGDGEPVVDASNSGHAINLSADGIILEGFTATNASMFGHAGIRIISNNNIITNNNVSNNDRFGIFITYSSGNTFTNNNVNNNSASGVQLYYLSDNTFTNNNFNNNDYGIYLAGECYNNIFTNNNASNNGVNGISVYTSSNNEFINNNVNKNDWRGIRLSSSNNNILYYNNFVDNTNHNIDEFGINQWDSGTEGNHYGGDYTGTDSDGDGIGDTPHPIPGGSSVDRYPLMAPYSPPSGLQDRSLVQVEGESEVYWFQNDRLYWVTDWNVINDMPGVPGWDSVNALPAGEFNPAGYPQGPRFITTGVESDSLLIREQGHPEVYLISGGEKHHFTSPEALLWNGHSFDDVIDVSAAIIGMFPSGSDISITQAIINKYNNLGGEATFGAPAGTGEQLGYPDSSGVVCSYVNFQNGAIECFTSGDYAGNAYAILNPFFDKWASMGYGKSVLGYPVSDMSGVQTPSFGTPSRYQKFINGTEEGSLEYNLTSGEVFEIHGAIYAKWSAMGYSNSILGLVTSDEREAVQSFKGTTGRVSDFENGHLHWHSSGEHEGVTYMTYDELDEVYASTMSGTASWLGFPVMDQEERAGYGYCEFEGGYIEWDGSEYKAKEHSIPSIDCEKNVLWGKTFDGVAESVQQTFDGSYIFTGYKSFEDDSSNVLLLKTDSEGNEVWSKTFGGEDSDYAHSVQQTSDGGYILAGGTVFLEYDSSDALLIKTDSEGNEVWSRTFGGANIDDSEEAKSVQQTSDGGYIFAGYIQSFGEGSEGAWLIKADSEGNEVWSKTFGGNGYSAYSVQQTSDGGYIIGARSWSFEESSANALLIKTNSEGNEVWSRTFGGADSDYAYSIQQISDGGYILAGSTRSFGEGSADAWLIKTDSEGNEVWSKTFGGEDSDYAHSVQQISDGGYILAGSTRSFGEGSADAWLIKTDSEGNEVWSKTFGGENSDSAYWVKQTSDGSYVLAGNIQSFGEGPVWRLMKVGGAGSDCNRDLNIRSISLDTEDDEIIDLGEYLIVNSEIENLGQDIYFADHDIYIRFIAGDRLGHHNVLQEEKFSEQFSLLSGETKRISKRILVNSFSNNEGMIMVDAIEVEISSNDYNDISDNIFIKHHILTLLDHKVFTGHLFKLTYETFSLAGVPISELDTFMETDPEFNELRLQYQMNSGGTIDAIDIYCKFFKRLIEFSIEFLDITDDPMKRVEFIAKLEMNFIKGLWDFGETIGFEAAHIFNHIYHFTTGIQSETCVDIFHVESPVDIEVIDNNSQHTGYVNGNIINDIEDSYVKINGTKKSVIIFSESNSDYIVKLMGTADGTFSFYTYTTKNNINVITEYKDIPVNTNSIGILETKNSNLILNIDFDGNGIIDKLIPPNLVDIKGEELYNITLLPPITTPDRFNLSNGRTLPIKFTARDNETGEFIYDDSVNVTITNSTGHLIAFFTNGTGTDSVRINSTEEQYIVNFHTKDYDLNVGETYTIHVTFGEADTLRGYAITHFTLV